MGKRTFQYRLWHILLALLALSALFAAFRPIPVQVEFELVEVVPHTFFRSNLCARVRVINTSSASLYFRNNEIHMSQGREGQWQDCAVSEGGGSTSDDVHIVILETIQPRESKIVTVPLLQKRDTLKICVHLSTSKYFRWSWYWSPEMKLSSLPSISALLDKTQGTNPQVEQLIQRKDDP